MTDFCINAYFKAKNFCYNLTHKENGDSNIIAIVLVLAVVIVLAVVFRKNIANLFNGIWTNIKDNLNNKTQNGPKMNSQEDVVGFIRALFI